MDSARINVVVHLCQITVLGFDIGREGNDDTVGPVASTASTTAHGSTPATPATPTA
jgi:hypothetical protein